MSEDKKKPKEKKEEVYIDKRGIPRIRPVEADEDKKNGK